jgi:hypothetical protein
MRRRRLTWRPDRAQASAAIDRSVVVARDILGSIPVAAAHDAAGAIARDLDLTPVETIPGRSRSGRRKRPKSAGNGGKTGLSRAGWRIYTPGPFG